MSKTFFEKLFNKDSITFVCPENQMCRKGYKVISNGGIYAVAKSRRKLNNLSPQYGCEPGDWLNLYRIGICDEKDGDIIAKRNEWIDTAIKEKKWLIEMWHDVSTTKIGFQTITHVEAEMHLDYIAKRKNDFWVALFSDAVKYIYERQNANVIAFVKNGFLNVFVEINNLPRDIFNQVLTVCIDCSSTVFNNSNLSFEKNSGNRVLYVDLKPFTLKRIPLFN